MASGCWPRAPLRFSQLNMVAEHCPLGLPRETCRAGGSCLREEERVLTEGGGCLVEGEEGEGGRKVEWVEEGGKWGAGEQQRALTVEGRT